MNREVRDEWVARLRSGDYSQTTGNLQDEYGYCCLGVLCTVAEDRGIVVPKEGIHYTVDAEDSFIPESVYTWADIDRLSRYDSDHYLYRDNDSRMPFNEIADIIEEKF